MEMWYGTRCGCLFKQEERGKPMFWDKVAGVYDLFENLYNKKVYRETGIQVAKLININDKVLECA